MTPTPPVPPVEPFDGDGADGSGGGTDSGYTELLMAALDQVPAESVLVFDCDLVYRVARGGALRPRGFEPTTIEGRPVKDVVGDRWPIYEAAYLGALGGRTAELQVRSPDGTRTFEVRVAPLRDDDGEVIGGVSVAVDVTEHVEEEARLRLSEQRWRRTMDDAPIAMAVESPEGAWLDVNPAMCEMFGLSHDDLLTRTWQDLTHPDDLAANQAVFSDLLAGRTDRLRHRKRYLHADGHVLVVDVAVTPIRDADGHALFQVAQLVDVSEQVRVEAELRRSEEELRMILDSSPDAIVRLDGDGRIVFANSAVGLGGVLDPGQLVGLHFRDIEPPDAGEGWGDQIERAYRTGDGSTFDTQVGLYDLGLPNSYL